LNITLPIQTISAFSVAVLLFAPVFKTRFGLTDNLVNYAPVIVLILAALLTSLLAREELFKRFKTSLVFLIILFAGGFSLAITGGEAHEIMTRLVINTFMGILITIIPWNGYSLRILYLTLTIFGVALSINTFLIYDSLDNVRGYEEELKTGYLPATFALGISCLAGMYWVIERFNPVSIGAFVTCWIGIALTLGRGSLIFCAFVSVGYLIYALNNKITSFSKGKKLLVFTLFAGLIPIVITKMLSVERTRERMTTLFTDLESRGGVQGRFNKYTDAWADFTDSPIIGNGLGAYRRIGDQFDDTSPHNIFLQYAVDGGLLGLALIALFTLIVLRYSITSIKKADPHIKNYILASTCLYLYMILSYQKSHDAYFGRSFFILSAIALATSISFKIYRKSTRRRLA